MLRGEHGCGLMITENACCAVCAPPIQLSIACTVKLKVPVSIGVPVINPEELRFSPDGNEPAITLKATGACPPEVVI